MKIEMIQTELDFLKRVGKASGTQAVYERVMLEISYDVALSDPSQSLGKVVDVMQQVDAAILSESVGCLSSELPSWFMVQFAPTPTKEAAQKWNDEWRSATLEQRAEMDAEDKWDFSGWIYWLMPESRQWLLKSIEADERFLHIVLAVEGLPFPVGALEVLVQFCAAPEQVELVVS